MRSGPGRGYPVFHIEERGQWVDIQRARTRWFKVVTRNGKQGWVNEEQMQLTLTPLGEPTILQQSSLEQFVQHKWELGVLGGKFEDADNMTVYGSYALVPNLAAELSLTKIFSSFSSAEMATVNLSALPFPDWRVSPFFSLGTGIIHTNPKATLVQEPDRFDQIGNVSIGAKIYVIRQFMLRVQFKHHIIFQSTNENQGINQWNAGFVVFF